jgi:hypothetical protein
MHGDAGDATGFGGIRRRALRQGNLDLNPPLNWKINGDS